MYLLAKGDSVERYPYTLGMLMEDNANTSFSLDISDEGLSEWGMFPVELVEPQHDPLTETFEEGAPVYVEGVWRQTWNIRQATPEEIQQRKEIGANYLRFYDELLVSALYQKIRKQAALSLPLTLACTEFIAAFADAKAGRPNLSAIQSCFDNILGAAALANADLVILRTLMQDCGLLRLFAVPEAT